MGNPRNRVIDATLRLAARRDFDDVTLSDIAQEAQLTLGELRDLFPSKGAIVGGFSRRIDREVLDAELGHSSEPARERLYAVLRRRLDALEPHRDALASISRWASRDPMTLSALNREAVNSMRFMLEAADIENDGPVGALKTQGLAFAWKRVVDDWLERDAHAALATLDRELSKGERYVDHAEDLARWTRPLRDIATHFFDWTAGKRRRDADDDYPHHHA